MKDVAVAASRQTGLFVLLLAGGAMFAALIAIPFVLWNYQQWNAQSFPKTTGEVLKMVRLQNARGRWVEQLDIHVEYFVGGRRYECTTLRFDTFPEMPSLAPAIAKRYPVGSIVTVYYRPGIPSDSLLEPGLDWHKLNVESLLWLCLVGFIIGSSAAVTESSLDPPMFLRPITDGRVVTVHTESQWGSLAMAGLSLSVLGFGGGILVAVTWADAKWLAIPVWLAVLLLPPFFYRAFRENWEQGLYDLTIDFEKGTVTLPGAALTLRKTLKIADIKRIVVRPARGKQPLQRVVVVQLEYPLLWVGGGEDGKAFDDWLAAQLGIPVIVDDPNQSKVLSRSARNSRT